MYIHICVCICMYICMCIYIYIYTCIYIYRERERYVCIRARKVTLMYTIIQVINLKVQLII